MSYARTTLLAMLSRKLMLGLLVIVIACVGPTGESSLRIAFNTWVGYGPLFVAQKKGYFKDEGLDVHLEFIEGTGERRAAMLAGRIDVLGSTIDDFVVGRSAGLNGVMVLLLDRSNGADGIVARDGIEDISDLAGKRVAVQPGFVNHFFLLYLLDKEGLSPDDIIVYPLDPDKAATALLKGEADVAVTWEPHLSTIKNQEGFNLILTTREVSEAIILDNLIVREDVARDRPGDVRKLIAAWYRAVDYLRTDADDAREIIREAFDIPTTEEVGEMLAGVDFIDMQRNREYFENMREDSVYKLAGKVAELYRRAEVIKNNIGVFPIDDAISDQFVKDVN